MITDDPVALLTGLALILSGLGLIAVIVANRGRRE